LHFPSKDNEEAYLADARRIFYDTKHGRERSFLCVVVSAFLLLLFYVGDRSTSTRQQVFLWLAFASSMVRLLPDVWFAFVNTFAGGDNAHQRLRTIPWWVDQLIRWPMYCLLIAGGVLVTNVTVPSFLSSDVGYLQAMLISLSLTYSPKFWATAFALIDVGVVVAPYTKHELIEGPFVPQRVVIFYVLFIIIVIAGTFSQELSWRHRFVNRTIVTKAAEKRSLENEVVKRLLTDSVPTESLATSILGLMMHANMDTVYSSLAGFVETWYSRSFMVIKLHSLHEFSVCSDAVLKFDEVLTAVLAPLRPIILVNTTGTMMLLTCEKRSPRLLLLAVMQLVSQVGHSGALEALRDVSLTAVLHHGHAVGTFIGFSSLRYDLVGDAIHTAKLVLEAASISQIVMTNTFDVEMRSTEPLEHEPWDVMDPVPWKLRGRGTQVVRSVVARTMPSPQQDVAVSVEPARAQPLHLSILSRADSL
jgi:hypothetical protein